MHAICYVVKTSTQRTKNVTKCSGIWQQKIDGYLCSAVLFFNHLATWKTGITNKTIHDHHLPSAVIMLDII
jgi:hypothetical protein